MADHRNIVPLPNKDIIRPYRKQWFRNPTAKDKKVIMETLINLEQQLDLSRSKQAQLVHAETFINMVFGKILPKFANIIVKK